MDFPVAKGGQVENKKIHGPDGHVVDPPKFQLRDILIEGNNPAAVFLKKAAQQGSQLGGGGIKKDDVIFSGERLGQEGIRETAVIDEGGGSAALHGHVVDGKKPVKTAGQVHGRNQASKAHGLLFGAGRGKGKAAASLGVQQAFFFRHSQSQQDGELADAQFAAELPGGGECTSSVFAAAQSIGDHLVYLEELSRTGHDSPYHVRLDPPVASRAKAAQRE